MYVQPQHLLTSVRLPPPPDFYGLVPGNSVYLLFLSPLCASIRLLSASRAFLSSLDLELLIHPSQIRKQLTRLCSFKNQFVLVQCLFLTAQSLAQDTSGPEFFWTIQNMLGKHEFLEVTSLKIDIFMSQTYLAITDGFSLTQLKVPKISMEMCRQKRLN